MDISTPELTKLQETYDLLIEGSHAVWGETAAGGGVSAKQKIEELEKDRKNKSKLTVSTPQTTTK